MEHQDQSDLRARFQYALALHHAGDFARARAAYEEILRLQPNHFEALHMLGVLACDTHDTRNGIELLLRVIALYPQHAAAHCNLGSAYQDIDRIQDALASFDRAIALRPDLAVAHYNRANILKDLGKLEDAVAGYDAAVSILPDLAQAHVNRALALSDLGRFGEALAGLDRAIRLKPNRALAHCNRGSVLISLGRYDQALASFMEALRLDPEYTGALIGFSTVLRHVVPSGATSEFRRLLVRCMESAAIESRSVARASAAILRRDLERHIKEKQYAFSDSWELDRATEGLLLAHLAHHPIVDRELEVFLANVRKKLLLMTSPDTSAAASVRDSEIKLLIALAQQSFLNEYLWRVEVAEQDRVAALEKSVVASINGKGMPLMRDLLLLAAYRPLHEVEEIRGWCLAAMESLSADLKSAFTRLVADPVREAELAAGIEDLTPVEDAVSIAVQLQYEESPYPRWESLTARRKIGYIQLIRSDIAPYRPKLLAATDMPQVLVAGCGSGKEPLETALEVEGSFVLAVDLSKKSLAYGYRKAMDMKVTNIKFARADILKLPRVAGPFDVIACNGVLHHMANPGAGLEALLVMLNPGGFIKLGLYSQLARRDIVRLREIAAERGLPITRQDIRSLREALLDADTTEVRSMQASIDFYSTSAVRDLLFHVHEHRFSIAQVHELISNARLEFLGFVLPDPRVKLAYAGQFSDDPDFSNLRNWQRFETANPGTFSGMYQFWCRKPA
jgi:Tfp pilus assembly protein PilF/SAM-dependent methyltransferase